jgi:uncharacterized protein (TIGR03083 family)
MPTPEVTPTPSPGTADGLLAEVCDALDAELSALDADAWSLPAEYGWSVRDVVAHLTSLNELLVSRATRHEQAPITRDDVCKASEAARRAGATTDVTELLDAWRRSVRALGDLAPDDREQVGWVGVTLPVSIAVVDCAFAAWLHGNEIRHAIGRASLDPSAGHLRLLCELAVRLVPVALAAGGARRPGSLQLSLSGPGGGDWVVPLDETGEAGGSAVASMCASARDFCLLMGDRIDPLDFAYLARGDDTAPAIAASVVEAVRGFTRR